MTKTIAELILFYVVRVFFSGCVEMSAKAPVFDFVDKPRALQAGIHTRKRAYRGLGINEKNSG